MVTHKIKIYFFSALILTTVLSTGVITVNVPVAVRAQTIPAGCPGSPLAGPPAPGVCESIPAGCPGSPLAGPPSGACPYVAEPPAGSGGGVGGEDRDTINRNQCRGELTNDDNCLILVYLVNGINFLSAIAGMVFVFSLMWAGYQYMTARDNSGQIQQARTRIIWTIVAIAVFAFMYAILDFLVPGGVLPGVP